MLLTSLTFAVAAVRLSRTRHARAVHERDRVAGQRRHRLPRQDRHAHRRQAGRCTALIAAGRRPRRTTCARSCPVYAASGRVPQRDAGRGRAPACRARPRATLAEVPFSSRWKWSAHAAATDGWLVLGAPDVLLGRCGCRPRCRDTSRRAAGCSPSGGAGQVVSPADGGGGTPRIEPLALVVLEERLRTDAARHDRLPAPPGRRREGDVGRLAGDGGGRRRARRHRRVAGTPRQGSRPARRSGASWRSWRARRRCSPG